MVFRVVEQEEFFPFLTELSPGGSGTGDCKNTAGGHIIEADRSQGIDKRGDAGIVREDGYGVIGVIQPGDSLFECLNGCQI